MNSESSAAYVAFNGEQRIAAGDLREVARSAKAVLERRKDASILVFDGLTGNTIEIDFRGSLNDVLARLPEIPDAAASAEPRGPGRPKLGVVAREVTLLPRHWEWLAQQPGGASVALRKLVDEARRGGEDDHRIRLAREAAYRFMSIIAGNRPHYEDAIRALFADNPSRFRELIAPWPKDVRDHAAALADRAFRGKSRNPPVDHSRANR